MADSAMFDGPIFVVCTIIHIKDLKKLLLYILVQDYKSLYSINLYSYLYI